MSTANYTSNNIHVPSYKDFSNNRLGVDDWQYRRVQLTQLGLCLLCIGLSTRFGWSLGKSNIDQYLSAFLFFMLELAKLAVCMFIGKYVTDKVNLDRLIWRTKFMRLVTIVVSIFATMAYMYSRDGKDLIDEFANFFGLSENTMNWVIYVILSLSLEMGVALIATWLPKLHCPAQYAGILSTAISNKIKISKQEIKLSHANKRLALTYSKAELDTQYKTKKMELSFARKMNKLTQKIAGEEAKKQ